MRVSIIIPAYNVEKYLVKCIDSVKAQTYTDWECLIVDDQSTDGTLDMAHELTDEDPRFAILQTEYNIGIGGARNLGIKHAKGVAITFLDADDWIEEDAVEYMVNTALENPSVSRVFTPHYNHWPNGTITKYLVVPYGLHEANSPYTFCGFLCDVGHATGCLYITKNIPCKFEFPVVPKYEDMFFNMELIFAGGSTYITDRAIYHYIRHYDSVVYKPLSLDEGRLMLNIFDSIVNRHHAPEEIKRNCYDFLTTGMKSFMGDKFTEL